MTSIRIFVHVKKLSCNRNEDTDHADSKPVFTRWQSTTRNLVVNISYHSRLFLHFQKINCSVQIIRSRPLVFCGDLFFFFQRTLYTYT